MAAVTPALTAETTLTSALSTSSVIPAAARLLDAVPGTNLAPAGQGHGQPDKVFLSIGEQRCAMSPTQILNDMRVIIRHVKAP